MRTKQYLDLSKLDKTKELVKFPQGFLVYLEKPDYEGRSAHGRSTSFRDCNICGERFEYFVWSMRGCGKRCPNCNVHHNSFGAHILLKNLTKEQLKLCLSLVKEETK